MNKQQFIKLFSKAGTYKGCFFNWNTSAFTEHLNGGLGDLTVTIPAPFDNYGDIDLGDELQVWISDREAPAGIKVYSGEVDEIDTESAEDESVVLSCSGFIYQLATDLVQDTGNLIYKEFNQELGLTIEDILDLYQANRSDDKITYTAASIGDTGKTKAIRLYLTNPLKAIKSILKLADSDWNFRVDADNVLFFEEVPTTPDHIFIFKKDTLKIHYRRSSKQVVNSVIVTNGQSAIDPEVVMKKITDATSVTSYGPRYEFIRDSRFNSSDGGLTELGTRVVNTFKDPLETVMLDIIDSNLGGGYDIENIHVGDTFKLVNISADSPLSDRLLLITTKTYINGNYVSLVAEDAIAYVNRELQNRKDEYDEVAFNSELRKTFTT